MDTAGRLHTRNNLMDELRKVRRVINGLDDTAPHQVLLTLDATTGHNGLTQAQAFTDAVGCTGIFLAKLDGTAGVASCCPSDASWECPSCSLAPARGWTTSRLSMPANSSMPCLRRRPDQIFVP